MVGFHITIASSWVPEARSMTRIGCGMKTPAPKYFSPSGWAHLVPDKFFHMNRSHCWTCSNLKLDRATDAGSPCKGRRDKIRVD